MSNTAGLRFAGLIRVSTEQQEQQGESLHTQRSHNTENVELLGGSIVEWYGGQEHATPGWEKKEVDRLLADAAKRKFDALIVTNGDRWSRDNAKSHQGIEIFKEHGIRFFIGVTEYDLFNPEHVLVLDLTSTIGKFQAANQTKKSILNRIHRARRLGAPTCGRVPFGRIYDKATGSWSVDPDKQAVMEEVARRYLAGEPLPQLAEELGISHSQLHETLTRRCGDQWEQVFHCKQLNIHEVIQTPVPRLLPEETIQAILRQAAANKTFHHGHIKHRYLLGRMVFCAHCGYTLTGQTRTREGRTYRYYRHPEIMQQRECPSPVGSVNADALERAVILNLFETFGNPVAIQRAIEAATPNLEKVAEYQKRQQRLQAEQEKIQASKARLIKFIAAGTISEDEARKELDDLRDRDKRITEELTRLASELENIPTPQAIQDTAKRVSTAFRKTCGMKPSRQWAREQTINDDFHGMSWEDSRALVEMVFSGKTPDGKRMGVYVDVIDRGTSPKQAKRFQYRILGHLIDQPGVVPGIEPHEDDHFGAPMQRELLKEVSPKSGLYCQGRLRNCAGLARLVPKPHRDAGRPRHARMARSGRQ